MKNLYTKNNTDSFIVELKKIDANTARNFFLKNGYRTSSFEMPEYYVASGLETINLKPINWSSEMPKITKSLEFMTPKGFLGWRTFSLLNPYVYIHIVNELTETRTWAQLVDILTLDSLIYSYSTPDLSKPIDKSTKEQAINRWLLMAENDLVKDCVEFSFLTVTDIKNFYPSIYTHSIAWAVDGKNTIKNNRRDYVNFLGNRLDKLFQNARDGQTNGIPVGSMVSDFIAELILKRVDVLLSDWIKKQGLEHSLLITRYRDDYRILSCSEEDGKKVLKELGKILSTEFDLVLNEQKTSIYGDILEGAIRDWSAEINGDLLLRQVKYEEMSTEISFAYLKDILLKIYQVQKKYPNGRPSVTLLSKLITHLNQKSVSFSVDTSGIHTLISILRKLSLIREEVSAQIFILLDIFFNKLSEEVKGTLITEILETIKGEKDYDYQVVWLYRLCLAHKPDMCDQIPLNSSILLEVLGDEYVQHGKPDIEIFPTIDGLDSQDQSELKKFILVSDGILADAPNKEIDKEIMALFSYRNK